MKTFIIKLFLTSVAIGMIACGPKSSKDETPGEPNLTGTTQSSPQDPRPGQPTPKPPVLQPLPQKPIVVKALRERSSETFCAGLSEFLQNYTATKLKGTSLALIMESSEACREDSSKTNLGVHASFQLSKEQSQLRLAVNIVANFQGNQFTSTKVLIDRLGPRPAPFVETEADKVFGDLSAFSSELKAFANLTNAPFKIHGLLASQAYGKVETNFAPGNNRDLITQPKLKVDLLANTREIRIKELSPSYFANNESFLRCDKATCLGGGLTYAFEGTDLMLYSKPYVGANNERLKAYVKIKLSSDLLK